MQKLVQCRREKGGLPMSLALFLPVVLVHGSRSRSGRRLKGKASRSFWPIPLRSGLLLFRRFAFGTRNDDGW